MSATSNELDRIPVEATSLPLSFPAHVRAAALEYADVGVWLSRHLDQHAGFPQPQPLDVSDIALDPAHAAELLRAEWGLSDRPIRSVVHLLEAAGVRVFSLGQEQAEVSTFSFMWERVPYVFLQTGRDAVAQRFSLASELGHLAMHASDTEPVGTLCRIEEAENFGRAFLMPPCALYAHGSMWTSRDVISASSRYKAPMGSFFITCTLSVSSAIAKRLRSLPTSKVIALPVLPKGRSIYSASGSTRYAKLPARPTSTSQRHPSICAT